MTIKNQQNIACLGWGSLIWNQGALPIRGKWFQDGPILPLEFARESSDQRITLVIVEPNVARTRSLWALMPVRDLNGAKELLAKREGIKDENIRYSIGYWDSSTDSYHGKSAEEIGLWARGNRLDAVVWTNLKYGLRGARDVMPSYKDILAHINNLSHESRKVAEEYVRRAPLQIDTDYRGNLEKDLRWSPTSRI